MVWEPTSTVVEDWGRLQVVVNGVDVTFFRDVPTQVSGWSHTDPFGNETLSLRFPQISPFEALGSGALAWLDDWSDIEVYRVRPDETLDTDNPLFEGLIPSVDDELSADGQGLTIECIGALHQADLYVRAPGFISDPVDVERLVALQFKQQSRPNLRTQELLIEWPAWWGTGSDPNAADHTNDLGELITGFQTQFTGDWGRSLQFVRELVAYLQEPDDGTHGRLVWTVQHDKNRQPVLRLRDLTTVDWTITVGTPGITHNLHHDLTQSPNVIYGEGTDQAGMKWRNAFIGPGSVTLYRPLSVWEDVAPITNETLHEENTPNPNFDPTAIRMELHQNYGQGVSLSQAIASAEEQMANFRDPGWYGSIVLRVDPEEGSRFAIRAGDNIKLKHFRGLGATGLLLHIAKVDVDLDGLTATLTVDSKGRDLLTLAQMIERRSQDNQTPANTLRIGRESGITTDERAPWDEQMGAGMVPLASKAMQLAGTAPTAVGFRPTDDASLYVHIDADAGDPSQRWGFTEVVTQEYGTISIFEMTAYDINGNVVAAPFHIGIYGSQVFFDSMPLDSNGQLNPFTAGVFDDPTNIHPDNIILWGQSGQRAGYYPGLESEGDAVTGEFRDDGSWEYRVPIEGGTSLWVALYCEHTSDVYFQGRMFRGGD